MKKNELAEIKKMELKDINARSQKARKEMLELIMDRNSGKVTDLKLVGKKRKDLAQMATIARQKELLAEMETK